VTDAPARSPRLGRPLVRLAEATSTNDLAKRLADAGVAEGAVVVAARQTHGRGRLGRAWASPPGGLWCSVLLRPGRGAHGLLSLAVGVATAEAVEAAGVPAALRWPNDVLVAGRKVAGVLLEAAGAAVVAGVGVNVRVSLEALPAEAAAGATSLHLHTRDVAPEAVLASLLGRLEHWYGLWAREPAAVAAAWSARDALRGRTVRAAGAEPVEGTADGITADGALIIRGSDGRPRTVVAGDVSLAAGRSTPDGV
jgi:BirA family biotin operon repressor/biotin-[acetyl-CoA-carboxylase] ligase